MTMITFLGGEETDNKGSLQWGEYNFILNKPIECNNPDIIKKAMTNRFFMVGNQAPKDITLEKTEYTAMPLASEVAKRPPGRPAKAQAEAPMGSKQAYPPNMAAKDYKVPQKAPDYSYRDPVSKAVPDEPKDDK